MGAWRSGRLTFEFGGLPLVHRLSDRMPAACNVWRRGDADSMSARTKNEFTTDAGYTTAGFYPLVPNRSGSCCCGGVHI